MGEHTPDVFEPAPDFSVKTANEDIFQLSRALSEGTIRSAAGRSAGRAEKNPYTMRRFRLNTR